MRLSTAPRSSQCVLVSRRSASRPSGARSSGHCVSGVQRPLAWPIRTATSFNNPDHVSIVIHNYRWRLNLAEGEPRYDI